MNKFILFSIIMAFIFPTDVMAGWDKYKEKSLESTIKEHDGILDSKSYHIVPSWPQLALAKYLAEIRPTPSEHAKVIRMWLKTVGHDEEIINQFQTEVLFEENEKKYWLPVQKVLIPLLKEELQKGDSVWLYVGWIGTSKTDWIFIVNEFEQGR